MRNAFIAFLASGFGFTPLLIQAITLWWDTPISRAMRSKLQPLLFLKSFNISTSFISSISSPLDNIVLYKVLVKLNLSQPQSLSQSKCSGFFWTGGLKAQNKGDYTIGKAPRPWWILRSRWVGFIFQKRIERIRAQKIFYLLYTKILGFCNLG